MRTTTCPSDLSDAQWATVKPLLPPAPQGGRPRKTEMREVIDAIFYILRTGATKEDGGGLELQHRSSETPTYNDDGTLASISFSGAPIGDLGYIWDANKNKTSESIGGVMSGYGFTAGYNAEDRLTSWDRADASLDQSWELSPVGDWNSITENAAVQNRTHGPVHEILTAGGQSVEHDAKGNMTSIPSSLRPTASPLALKWDFDNKLKAAATDNDGIDDVFYRWDALGRRVGRDDGTNHVIYFQDGQQTLADYPAGGAAGNPTYTYVYGSYIDEVVLRSGGSGIRYYHRNGQYSIIALTDATRTIVERYAYTPYGQVTFTNASGTVQTASASNNRYTYTGRERDEDLGLYHYRARMYDPVAGRFVTRDPIGFGGVSMSLYSFVLSSPLKYVDPDGHYPRICCSAEEVTGLGLVTHCQIDNGPCPNDGRNWQEYQIARDMSCRRTMEDGTRCCDATNLQIQQCTARQNPGNAGSSVPGDNCNTSVNRTISNCCLVSNWRRPWYTTTWPDLGYPIPRPAWYQPWCFIEVCQAYRYHWGLRRCVSWRWMRTPLCDRGSQHPPRMPWVGPIAPPTTPNPTPFPETGEGGNVIPVMQ